LVVGNLSRILWQRGHDYLDAAIDGLVEWTNEPFEAISGEPTYDRPILVITNILNEGVMLGHYQAYLNKKGIGVFSDSDHKILGFKFISKNFNVPNGIGVEYFLDSLYFFNI